MSISIKPLEDRIVVQTVEAEQTTASGLVIPDTAKEKPQEGKVVAVGPGRVDDSGNRVPVDVAEGDVVIYSKYGGTGAARVGAGAHLLQGVLGGGPQQVQGAAGAHVVLPGQEGLGESVGVDAAAAVGEETG